MTVSQFELHEIALPDGALLKIQQRRRAGAVRVVFSHGAGLAIAGYESFVQALSLGYEVVSFDLRGHGTNSTAALPDDGILDRLTDDMEAIWHHLAERLDPAPTVGVFHSISGILALRQIMEFGPRWAALALLDPPMTPPAGHRLMPMKQDATAVMIRRTAKRRHRFEDAREYAADLARRPEFGGWQEGTHLLLAAATLRPDEGAGGSVLIVPPETEAQIYRENVLPGLAPTLPGLSLPLRMICSDPEGRYASPIPTLCEAIARDCGIGFETVRNTTHMLPLEQPQACADAVAAFLAANGFPPAG